MKYHRGDVVSVVDQGKEAVVIDSYSGLYGGPDQSEREPYGIMFLNGDRVSWFHESQMLFIRHEEEAFIGKIRADRQAEDLKRGKLDWIVANWDEAKGHSASLQALYAMIGGGSLWGPRGEGIDYYVNSISVRGLFEDVMAAGDLKAVQTQIDRLKGLR